MSISKHIRLIVTFLIISVSTITNTLAGSGEHHELVHWGYQGDTGPSHWGDISPEFSPCKEGRKRSPIDINDTVKSEMNSIKFNYHNSSLNIINNGHTIQVNYNKSSSMTIDRKKYNLIQVHFHAPSEHKIKGKSYPMAAHLVHKSNDGQMSVVAILMEEGKENAVINAVWKNLPKETGKNCVIKGVKINISKLLPKERSYYNYSGSLTTPPCTECVQWYILKTPVTVSKGQVDKFTTMFGNNARPVQPINERIVRESF